MQEETKEIYHNQLPDELIETLNGNDEAIIDFIIGTRQREKAKKYGLSLILLLGDSDFLTQRVQAKILLRGQPYWITLWLMEYHPQYP